MIASAFTIKIFVPDGDPDGLRIIERQSSPSKFFAFPRHKWGQAASRIELAGAGVYILSGYTESDDTDPNTDLPTIYIGQADNVGKRIEQHEKGKEFWDKAVVFVSGDKINSTHAKWLEHSLLKRAQQAGRSKLENGNSPSEPGISESEKAEIQVFLTEIYQTLPLAGIKAFEMPESVVVSGQIVSKGDKDTIVVPGQKEGFDRVFLGEDAWYAIRVSGGMLDKIKYIAGYQTAPISAITHYAEVARIEPYGEEGKYKLIFKGKAIRLPKPISLAPGAAALQSPRYTIYTKLRQATKLSDVF